MAVDVLALVSVCGTVLIGVIAQIQQSRCVRIDACCVSCERDLSVVEPTNTNLTRINRSQTT